MTAQTDPNRLYYGDNLQVLREHLKDASVDLIYLDPPFNSKRDYNLLFKTPKSLAKSSRKNTLSASAVAAPEYDYSDAQITAFEDTWHWNEVAEREFSEILKCGNTDVAELMQALRAFLKQNDMLAYLTMMCNRLLELHRVLKPTGSLYLHCDPTASHYLKLVLDGVFGKENYRNEITWKRRVGFSSAVHESRRFGSCTDIIFFYAKSEAAHFSPQYNLNDPDYNAYIEERFTMVDESGRLFQPTSLVNPAMRPNLKYTYKGYEPPENGWMISREKMEEWDREGRIYFPKEKTGRLRRKSYADELKGMPIQNLWTDIAEINSQAEERMGYPTQKPVALLERIIWASSNEGDVVLDPFCGCGTAVYAAEKLGRRWVGIDITHLSIGLVERRMKEAFPALQQRGAFEVVGTPKDFGAARDLAERDKYQFQSWACMLVGAQLYKGGRKGADGGVDGLLWIEIERSKTEKVIVQVKGGGHGGRAAIATLIGDVSREKAAIGLFITLIKPTREMVTESAAAGLYESPHHGAFPKIQILTIEGLMSGKERPQFPDMSGGGQTLKKAKKENKSALGKQVRLI